MKVCIVISLSVVMVSCTAGHTSHLPEPVLPPEKIIVVSADLFPQLEVEQDYCMMRGLDGEWIDAQAPMRSTGRFHVTFDHDEKSVVLPWPGKQPPRKYYANIRATVLVTTTRGKTGYSILKMELDGEAIYEKMPAGP